MMSLGGAGAYSAEHGQVLDGNAMRFAQVVADYNHNFRLEFIPERERNGEAPYRIVDTTPGLPQNVVRYVSHEQMQQPQKVLAEIFKGDLRHHSANSILTDMELEDAAARLMNLKLQEEKALESEELVAFYLEGGKDGKHYLNYNGHKIER